jgi:putative hemolysin
VCTLSWRLTASGYDVVMNRDERRTRPSAEAPRPWPGPVPFLAPRDPEGGGSWIAVNAAGLTVCLLNDYGADAESPPAPVSRGRLLVEAAGLPTGEAARSWILDADLRAYRPFHLVLFEPGRAPVAWRWTGVRLLEHVAPAPPLTTSSYRSQKVEAARRRAWRRRFGPGPAAPTAEALLDFHGSRAPRPDFASVAMRRSDACTVSLTHVSVRAGEAVMRYHPGDPARPQPTGSVAVMRLAVQTRADPWPDPEPVAVSPTTFDVPALFREKAPELRIPAPVLSGVARVVGARRINEGLHAFRDVRPRHFPAACLAHLRVRAEAGARPLPPPGTRPIFVANHPLGGLDGLVLLAFLLRWYPKLVVPVNDVLARIPPLSPFVVPVDKFGGRRAGLRALHDLFASDAAVLVFPAGRTARRVDGRLVDAPWNRLPVAMARRHGRPLVPVHVDGRNSALFYGVATLRRRLGVNANLEMFLLPRELLSPAHRRIGVRVGDVLSPADAAALGQGDEARAAALQALCFDLDDAPRAPALERAA